jgi:hypothetical protein
MPADRPGLYHGGAYVLSHPQRQGSLCFRRRTMTPQDAAQRFVELVLRTTFDDVLDLMDPGPWEAEADPETRARAYKAIETAVRRQFKMRHDLGALEHAVGRVVPKQHQGKFTKLSDAIGAELGVVRHAGYVVGLAVGRALQPAASARIGKGWTPTLR